MFENLNQPYPFNNNFKHNLRTITMVIMAFMLISLYFQPFGIDFFASRKDGYFILFLGAISAAIFFFNTLFLPGLFPKLFESARWTIRKELIWNAGMFLALIVGFALVALYFKIASMESLTLFRSGALALLPLVLFNLMNYNYALKTKVVKAIDSGRHWFDEQQEKERIVILKEKITLISENGKDVFEENVNNILLIQSAGNYVEVFFRKDNVVKRQVIRQTLSNTETQVLDYPTLLKCHRRCIVNTEQVKRFGGTSPNFTLEVEGLDFRIPVSRQKAAELRKLFTKK